MTWVTRGSLSAYILSLCPSTRDIFVPSSLHEIYQTVLKNIFIFPYFFIISPWKMAGPFIWIHFNSPSPKMLCAKFGWNWLHGSGEKEFLNFLTVSLLFPLEKERVPSFEQTKIPFTQKWFVPCFVESGKIVLKKKTFRFRQCIFAIVIIPVRKGLDPSFEQTWIPFTKGWLVSVWLKLMQRFWRKIFLNFVNVFSLFRYYLPWKRAGSFLNKLVFPSSKVALCQVWLKLVQWFWRKWFINFINLFSQFRVYLFLEKDGTLHLNKHEYPLITQCCFVPSLKLAQWFLRKGILNFVNVISLYTLLSPLGNVRCSSFEQT